MKHYIKTTLFALVTGLSATVAIAAPEHAHHTHQDQNEPHYQHQAKVNRHASSHVNWKTGDKVPAQYYSHANQIDHKRYKNLSKPARNQQWIKVNGDYVLINTRSHQVIKVVHH